MIGRLPRGTSYSDGCIRGRGRLDAPRVHVPEHEPRPAVQRRPTRSGPGRPHVVAPAAAPADGRRRSRAADRVRERREPSACPRGHSTAGGRHSDGGRSRPDASRAPVAYRVGPAGVDRFHGRPGDRNMGRAAPPSVWHSADGCAGRHAPRACLHADGRGDQRPFVRPRSGAADAAAEHHRCDPRRRGSGGHRRRRDPAAKHLRRHTNSAEPDAARRRRAVRADVEERHVS